MDEICTFDIGEIKHHIIKDIRLRKMYIWDLIWKLFGKNRKFINIYCKAETARMPYRNYNWIMRMRGR